MIKRSIVSAVALLLVLACATVPITGRRQLSLVPESTIEQMSFAQYDSVLASSKLSNDQAATQMVRRVGGKIANAVGQYFASKNQSDQISSFKWDFNLINDTTVINAWCMPGGKVAVYTGILPYTKNDTGLAVVLGHEIAHAVAHHGDERMSQGMIAQFGGMALSTALQNKPAQTQSLFMTAYGLGTTVGALLPYSRLQESEADHIGLIFMAMAGYNPHAAIPFWQRMSQASNGAPPEFLSTHPADATRIKDIEKLLPEAMSYYKK
jgi:predicted Zn-dependent protease